MKNKKVFYDGLCVVCDLEIQHYKKKDTHQLIEWIDISQPEFEAHKFGLETEAVNKYMHALDGNEVVTGVDVFLLIWKTLKIWKPITALTESKWARPIFNLGYHGFIHIRPYLPRKKQCNSERCEVKL